MRTARLGLLPVVVLAAGLVTPRLRRRPGVPARRRRIPHVQRDGGRGRGDRRRVTPIVRRFSIGRVYQGRELWAVKVSDNVARRRARAGGPVRRPPPRRRAHEPGDDARASSTGSSTGYGTDATITSLVNTREIWIVFDDEPRRREYDIAGRHVTTTGARTASPTPGSTRDRHRPQPQLRLSAGAAGGGPSANPRAITLSRADGVLGARDAGVPRLRREPRGRRPPADHGRDHASTTGRLVMWPLRLHADRTSRPT